MTLIENYLAMVKAFFVHLGDDAVSTLEHYLTLAQPMLDQYGYLAVFVAVLVEGFGIPAPGQTMLMAGAILAAQGGMSISLVLTLAFLAAMLGNILGYALGRWGGRLLLQKVPISPERMARIEKLFARYGGGVVFFGRFFDGLRQLNGIMAGALAMPWWKFFIFNLLGSLVWTALWGLGVYFLDKDIKTVFAVFHAVEPYVIVGSLLAVMMVVLYLSHHRKSEQVE